MRALIPNTFLPSFMAGEILLSGTGTYHITLLNNTSTVSDLSAETLWIDLNAISSYKTSAASVNTLINPQLISDGSDTSYTLFTADSSVWNSATFTTDSCVISDVNDKIISIYRYDSSSPSGETFAINFNTMNGILRINNNELSLNQHSHAISDIVDLTSDLAIMTATINSKQDYITPGTSAEFYAGDKTFKLVDYSYIANKPLEFPPEAHIHIIDDITGLTSALDAKQDYITPGTSAEYWSGDKTWRSVADAQQQTDYTQTDTSALDYIKNKPDLSVYTTIEEDTGKLDSQLAPLLSLQTTLINGGHLTITSGHTNSVNISAGSGYIVNNYTDGSNPVITHVKWDTFSIVDPLILDYENSYIGIDTNGAVVWRDIPFEQEDTRDYIVLGWTDHTDRENIDLVFDEPYYAGDSHLQFMDFLLSFGPFNISGNDIFPATSGGPMRLRRTEGKSFFMADGKNLDGSMNFKNPNTVISNAQDPCRFQYYYRLNTAAPDLDWFNEGTLQDDINPGLWDDKGTLRTVPNDSWTIQPLMTYPPLSDSLDIQYGQKLYNTIEEAKTGISEQIVIDPYNLYDIFRGWLIVKGSCNDLADETQAIIMSAGKLGMISNGASAGIGESNSASNIGTVGFGVYDRKIGVDLQFRNIAPASSAINITYSDVLESILIDIGTINKDMVGLSNVDNTSDVNKQISSATSAMFNNYETSAAHNASIANYATSASLSNYATSASLSGYATSAHSHVIATSANPGFLSADDYITFKAGGAQPIVTSANNGLMTSADKSKLDTVEASANNYTHPASHPPGIITQDSSNRFVTDAQIAGWNASGSTVIPATSASLGVVKIGANISVDTSGTISAGAPYVLPSNLPQSQITSASGWITDSLNNKATSAHTHSTSALSDVSAVTPTDRQSLVYLTSAAKYVPTDLLTIAAADGSGATGILSFGGLGINADPTKFNVGAIRALFSDATADPLFPTMVTKSFSATSGISVINLAAQNSTYLAVDINGVIHQSASIYEPTETRDWIPLGNIVHSNRVNINTFNNSCHVCMAPANQLGDLMDSIGPFNIYGNIFSYTSANNMTINKSVGHIFKQGSNFSNDVKDPHTLILGALSAPSTIRYRLSNGYEYSNTSTIDPLYYDNKGATSAARVSTGGNNTWSIQRIFIFPSNLIRIQYGQATYSSYANAVQNIQTELFIAEDTISKNAILCGLLIVRHGATNLSIPGDAVFMTVGKFGSTQGLGSSSVTSLQEAYNNSTTPEITTNALLGAMSVHIGADQVDTNNAFDVVNKSDVITASIDGNGKVTASSYIISELPSVAGSSSVLLTRDPSTSAINQIAAGTSATWLRGDKTWGTIDKTYLNLGNVDNTSDNNKPVSSAVSAQLALKEPTITSAAGNVFYKGNKTFGTVDYTILENTPSTFNPSAHVHTQADVTSASGWINDSLANKATSASLTNYATSASLSNYALAATLANYETSAAHNTSLTNYATSASLSGYATVAHGHTQADVASASGWITTALGTKEPSIATSGSGYFYKGDKSWALITSADVPNLDASKITSGTMAAARLGSGTPTSATFLNGVGVWAVPAGSGTSGTSASSNTVTYSIQYGYKYSVSANVSFFNTLNDTGTVKWITPSIANLYAISVSWGTPPNANYYIQYRINGASWSNIDGQLLANVADSFVFPSGTITLAQGDTLELSCTNGSGTSISCTAYLTGPAVTPLTTAQVKKVEIDLGSVDVYDKVVTITDAACTVGSKITASLVYDSIAGSNDADEIIMSKVVIYPGQAGSGTFNIAVNAIDGPIRGKFNISYILS